MSVSAVNFKQEIPQNKNKKGPSALGTAATAATGAGLGAGAWYLTGGMFMPKLKKTVKGGIDAFVENGWKQYSDNMLESAAKIGITAESATEMLEGHKNSQTEQLKKVFTDSEAALKKLKGKMAMYIAGGAAIIGGAYLLIKSLGKKKAE